MSSSQMKNNFEQAKKTQSSAPFQTQPYERKKNKNTRKLKGNKFTRHKMTLLRALRNRKKKKKPCLFCSKKSVFAEKDIYWRNAELLSRFLFSNFQIVGRKFSGVCHRHQLLVNQEVKKAKNMALIKTIDY